METKQKDNDTRTNAQSSGLESRHTPGPWFTSKPDANAVLAGNPQDPEIVAMLEGDDLMFVGIDKIEANARLIAAAPELLAALKTLFRECAMVHKYWGENCNQTQADAAVTKASEAIAKAEGSAR